MKMQLLGRRVHCTSCHDAPNCTSCGLFRPEEFLAFEYQDDLWFHGFDGPGSPFSGALG